MAKLYYEKALETDPQSKNAKGMLDPGNGVGGSLPVN
jgi:hypothetical protein